jgi:hypothetical protein
MGPVHPLLAPIRDLHRLIRDSVVRACEEAGVAALSGVAREEEGDTLYAIDRVAEDLLVEQIERTMATPDAPVVLVAEGLPRGERVVPDGADGTAARWVIIVDPIDGTRGLMYQKRPAWILTGVAAAASSPRTLADIELAVQTEIPLVKQHLCDEVWAVRGQDVVAVRTNRLTGEHVSLHLRPSTARTLEHGFSTVARFFPGGRAGLAALDDELMSALLGPPRPGKAQAFEDQYISSGGQLYELMAGHDRFVADLRPLVEAPRGGPALCCHPYDLCTESIARALGVVVTDERGAPLNAPLDVASNVSWIGYANRALKELIEPELQRAMARRGWLS